MSAPDDRGRVRRWGRWLYLVVLVVTLMTAGAVAALAAGLFTDFRARRLYNGVIAKWLSRLFLRLAGVRLAVHQKDPFPETQTIYIANHTSSMDVFVLLALGLPNARFFMKGALRLILPLGLMGTIMGTFWTYPQTMPRRRTKLFQRAERELRATGESVFLSPEGKVTLGGVIGPFNKGAFHLATNLAAPIVPLFILIPPSVDPGDNANMPDVRGGVVHVYVQPPIPTRDWKLADLDENRRHVRELFVALNERLRTASGAA
jgi:1-acyl-sn-glycerol-3-phosphate acyltransferase